ncbi:MFS general substrate transporter [Fistulina hepatica ATCC 64428]|uniref:MFS general substrate transporter n=1 Tax=Fistulina hepatica ATCC 64428 TaxID=1128425 RepID=A0A0D7A112_9AGAR|nr:MFS general substrate transporter [Fistulina hepatica ATCC 64428]
MSDPEKKTNELTNQVPHKAQDAPVFLLSFHEENAGRLVVDPEEFRIEYGDEVASKLKLSDDGKLVLWPQPTDSPRDPQNWSSRRKAIHLLVVTVAAVGPDFDSGIGIASLYALADEFDTTTTVINDLTSNWSIFLLGFGGIFAIMGMRRYGRLPILFWTQLLALGFLIGCTFAPNLKVFTAMRCLNGFFSTTPQVTGLYIVNDMYPFHLQARMLNIWTMGFLVSPYLSPFALGFLVAHESWRWAYGIGCIYSAIVLVLIMLFIEETAFDRTLSPVPEPKSTGLRYRIEALVGVIGAQMAKYRMPLREALVAPFDVTWRPHLAMILLYEGVLFGFSIGMNVTNVVFLKDPEPVGYGLSAMAAAGMYGTPIVSVILGEIMGRYSNDWIMRVSIRRNRGVFEAESRLWACYIAIMLYVVGLVTLGAGLQKHLSIASIIFGWGIAELGVMVNTVAVYAYANDAFPKHQGEISALITLWRTLAGFSVGYFQVDWAARNGALQVFGCEAAIAAGLFVLVVPALQLKGRALRVR